MRPLVFTTKIIHWEIYLGIKLSKINLLSSVHTLYPIHLSPFVMLEFSVQNKQMANMMLIRLLNTVSRELVRFAMP